MSKARHCEGCQETIDFGILNHHPENILSVVDPFADRYWCGISCLRKTLRGITHPLYREDLVSQVKTAYFARRIDGQSHPISAGTAGIYDELIREADRCTSYAATFTIHTDWNHAKPFTREQRVPVVPRDRFDERNPGGESSDGDYRR